MAVETKANNASATPPAVASSRRRRVLTDTGAYCAIVVLRVVTKWLPEGMLGTTAHVFGNLVFYVLRWKRRVAKQRVACAFPDLSHFQQQRLVRDSYAHLALSLLWFLRLPLVLERGGVDAIRQRVEINEATRVELRHLQADLTSHGSGDGASAIVMSGHIGMWELLPALLASSILPIHEQWVVYRPLHNPPVDVLAQELRGSENRHLVADKKCFDVLRDALATRTLSMPSIVGLMSDHRCDNKKAQCTVRFLGQDTFFPTGAARLHIATRSPLWFAALIANPLHYHDNTGITKPFKLVLRSIAPRDTTGFNAQTLSQAYAQTLEDTIRSYPSQYLWIHDLWKQRAAAEEPLDTP